MNKFDVIALIACSAMPVILGLKLILESYSRKPKGELSFEVIKKDNSFYIRYRRININPFSIFKKKYAYEGWDNSDDHNPLRRNFGRNEPHIGRTIEEAKAHAEILKNRYVDNTSIHESYEVVYSTRIEEEQPDLLHDLTEKMIAAHNSGDMETHDLVLKEIIELHDAA